MTIGRTLSLEFTLAVKGLTEQVVVQTHVPILQSSSAEISDVIDNREVMQLPINGRQFMALAQLSDAVVLPPGGTRGEALQQAGPLPNVGGQRSGHNIYLLDGTKVTDELFNNLVINPSIDSIEEFKIQKSMYPAEFGGKASALINVSTKAGANAFHGSLFEFHRDDALDARNYFHPAGQPKPPLRQNQFGGALGGPLARNRSFFFGSYERTRMRRSLTRTFSVPPAAVRAGNFAGLGSDLRSADDFRDGRLRAVCEQHDSRDRIDPIAAAFLRQRAAADFQRAGPEPCGGRGVDPGARSGERARRPPPDGCRPGVRSRQHLRRRRAAAVRHQRAPGSADAGVRPILDDHGRATPWRATRGCSGRSWLNELRVGWMKRQRRATEPESRQQFASQVGLLGVTTDPRDVGFPQISTGGLYSTMGDPTIFTTRANQHVELYDNVTIDRGSHRLKLGAYYFHLQLRPEQPDNARGAFTYTGQFTGNAFADFLLGYPTSATSGIGRGDEDGRTNWLHLYVQDDWQARGNLTFNAGLRYEFNQHMYDATEPVVVGRSVGAGRTLRDRV